MKRLSSILLLLINLTACSAYRPTSLPAYEQSSMINTQLGLAYLQKGDYPQAKTSLLKALKQNPKSIKTLDALAYFFEVTGDLEAAKKYYLQAVNLAPESGRANNNLGAYFCRVKDYSHGEFFLLRAAQNTNYAHTASSYESLGLCYLNQQKFQVAAKYLKDALMQNPHLLNIHYELAALFYHEGKFSKAKKYLNDHNKKCSFSAKSLWLGIEIANQQKDVATILRNGALLEKYFLKSKQYQLYQKMTLS